MKQSFIKTLSFFALLFLLAPCFAANNKHNVGARSTAMGHTSATLKDLWSVRNNQAGMAFLEQPIFGIAYENRFNLQELSLKSAAIVLPTQSGNFGLAYTHLGDDIYSESSINLGYARMFGERFAAGISLDYLRLSVSGVPEAGSTGAFTGALGIMGEPLDNFWIAAHLYNPFGVKLESYEYEEEVPTIMSLGLSYLFDDLILLTTEVEKDIEEDARFKAGVEYKFISQLCFRAGIASNPSEYSAGVGFNIKDFFGDVGFFKHQYLGFTPSFTLAYRLQKKRN